MGKTFGQTARDWARDHAANARQAASTSAVMRAERDDAGRQSAETDADHDVEIVIDDPGFWGTLGAINQAGVQGIANAAGGQATMFGGDRAVSALPREPDREAGQ